MKNLNEPRINSWSEEDLFRISLNSISGCKVKVGDELYSLWKEGDVIRKQKFKVDFELTEEEFKNLNIKYD